MPNYARNSDLDLEDMLGDHLKNDQSAYMRRNIPTKINLHSAHHCADKECTGTSKDRCINLLHYTWCPALVIDEDPTSDTYNEIVICGERFAVISPKGCFQHQYIAGFNLDIKDARNDRPNLKIKYKDIFNEFQAKHEENKSYRNEKQVALQRAASMTEPQKSRLRKQRDQEAHEKQREAEAELDNLRSALPEALTQGQPIEVSALNILFKKQMLEEQEARMCRAAADFAKARESRKDVKQAKQARAAEKRVAAITMSALEDKQREAAKQNAEFANGEAKMRNEKFGKSGKTMRRGKTGGYIPRYIGLSFSWLTTTASWHIR